MGRGGEGKFASMFLFPKMLTLGLDKRKDAAKITEFYPKGIRLHLTLDPVLVVVHVLAGPWLPAQGSEGSLQDMGTSPGTGFPRKQTKQDEHHRAPPNQS